MNLILRNASEIGHRISYRWFCIALDDDADKACNQPIHFPALHKRYRLEAPFPWRLVQGFANRVVWSVVHWLNHITKNLNSQVASGGQALAYLLGFNTRTTSIRVAIGGP